MSKRYFFIFTVSTFLITFIWIASNVYHSSVDSTVDPILQTQIEPISPKFDQTVIGELKKRQQVQPDTTVPIPLSPTPEEEEESSGSVVTDVTPTLEPIPQDIVPLEIPTPSIQLEEQNI